MMSHVDPANQEPIDKSIGVLVDGHPFFYSDAFELVRHFHRYTDSDAHHADAAAFLTNFLKAGYPQIQKKLPAGWCDATDWYDTQPKVNLSVCHSRGALLITDDKTFTMQVGSMFTEIARLPRAYLSFFTLSTPELLGIFERVELLGAQEYEPSQGNAQKRVTVAPSGITAEVEYFVTEYRTTFHIPLSHKYLSACIRDFLNIHRDACFSKESYTLVGGGQNG